MKKIAVSTINRLSQYYRTLGILIEKNTETVSSEEIADLEGVTSAQVRKDLSFFGISSFWSFGHTRLVNDNPTIEIAYFFGNPVRRHPLRPQR